MSAGESTVSWRSCFVSTLAVGYGCWGRECISALYSLYFSSNWVVPATVVSQLSCLRLAYLGIALSLLCVCLHHLVLHCWISNGRDLLQCNSNTKLERVLLSQKEWKGLIWAVSFWGDSTLVWHCILVLSCDPLQRCKEEEFIRCFLVCWRVKRTGNLRGPEVAVS